ncbi:hypothetical protein L598_003500000130 [Mesorhizobium sp. J18]|uniref:CAF17-like 4Fe-4S cluster assembly/insertion protein YgfZ n=1 Tax=Mesorhizobium sp. J18 TaxID=935263 RepID=UPI00119C118F|nr:folate-binding protein YgfZ [Mesorhizobium sp. J18]TWG94672.1 hypothetical protein L598_003500000130 [Mesorhizobium sp. J18]
MPTIHLQDRALLTVAGPEAEHFLQNVLTSDFGTLATGEARPGALLTPQGKILFDYLVSRNAPDSFLLECRNDIADDFLKRLMLYRLRAKAEISKRDQVVAAASWHVDSTGSQAETGLLDRRFPDEAHVCRFYADLPSQDASVEDWKLMRIRHGVAESGADYQLGDAFPHDVLLDQNGGVGLRKGCYVGQEVVSRMQHRGTARRRVLIAHGKGLLPATSTPVTAGGRSIGALGTVSGQEALAIVRIDRVKEAMDAGTPILAGEAEITLTIPAWAQFAFPESAEEMAGG